MRAAAIAIGVILACGTTASAQQAGFGVKAGVNIATIDFEISDEEPELDGRTGFVGGLFAVVPVSGPVGLQIEALYSQKGATFDQGPLSATMKLDYLDVPVLLRVSTPAASASFHVFGGPSFGVRLRARGESTFNGESHSEDIDEDVERFDLGLVAGAGVEFGRLVLDGRYTWGLTNVNTTDTDAVQIKNRVWSFMLGVRF